MFEDDDLEFNAFDSSDAYRLEGLFSATEMCAYVKEEIENKHGVIIFNIEYDCECFTFSVFTSGIDDMEIPEYWEPLSFGNGMVTFNMFLPDFQREYHKLEERDFVESVKVMLKRMYGSVCDIVSIKKQKKPLLGFGVEVIVRLKEGKRISFKESLWLPIIWIEDDLVAFEIDEEILRAALEEQ